MTAPWAPLPRVEAITYWFAKVTPARVSTWRMGVSRTPSAARVACGGRGGRGGGGGEDEEVGGGGGGACSHGASASFSPSSLFLLASVWRQTEVWRSREDQPSLSFFDPGVSSPIGEEEGSAALVLFF